MLLPDVVDRTELTSDYSVLLAGVIQLNLHASTEKHISPCVARPCDCVQPERMRTFLT